MLVLGRKESEKIVLELGDTIVTIRISKIRGNRATVSIDAPSDVRVKRGELLTKENVNDCN
jgi:sRNA-binding carbon storage regulator CsrA